MAEEHKLNTEYTGQTRLREWWPIVRSNFESLLGWFNAHIAGKADRHAATDIDYASGKTVKAKIDEETEAREKADGTISDLVSPDSGAKPTNLTDAINREIAKRQDEDNDLSGKIDDEKNEREEADNKLKELLGNFEELRHLGLTWDNLAGAIADVYTELGEADTAHKSAAVLDHPDGSVTTAKIKDKNVTTAKLAEGAVTNEKLSKEAVTTEKIANSAVTYLKIADDAVGESKIMDKAITVDKLNPRTLFELFGGVKVAFSSRTDEESPGDDAYISNVEYISPDFEKILGEPRIEPGSESESFFTYTPEIWVDVDRGDDYGYAVIVGLCEEGEAEKTGKLFWKSAESSGDYLLGRLVTTDKIEDGAVTSDKIADGAITSAKIPDNSVTENKIHDRAVTHIKLAENSVWEKNLGSQAVTNDKIANDAVTFNKIQDGAIITTKLYDGAVTNEKIAGDSISHDKLKSNSVWENHLGVDAVTAAKIANGAVTNSKLSNGAVTFDKLSSELYTYSKKPARVGTWVDGTPVWRAAIPITTLSAAGITRNENYINIADLLATLKILKYGGNLIYIDSMLRLQNDSKDYTFPASPSDGITESDVPGIYNIEWKSGEPAMAIYGWCEFATDESNIA